MLTVKLNHFQLTTLTYILSVIHNGLNWNGVTRTVICFNHQQHMPIAYAGISGNQRQFCVFCPTEANWQTAHSYLARLPCMSHTHIAHTYQFPSSPWASALDHCMVSVLRSRVDWASARNNEQTNTPQRQHIAPLGKIVYSSIPNFTQLVQEWGHGTQNRKILCYFGIQMRTRIYPKWFLQKLSGFVGSFMPGHPKFWKDSLKSF